VAAEVDHRWLEFAQLAQQVERLSGPAGDKLEAVPEAGTLKLDLVFQLSLYGLD
jgi:hypothetical protein